MSSADFAFVLLAGFSAGLLWYVVWLQRKLIVARSHLLGAKHSFQELLRSHNDLLDRFERIIETAKEIQMRRDDLSDLYDTALEIIEEPAGIDAHSLVCERLDMKRDQDEQDEEEVAH